jgi:hypothetical protein
MALDIRSQDIIAIKVLGEWVRLRGGLRLLDITLPGASAPVAGFEASAGSLEAPGEFTYGPVAGIEAVRTSTRQRTAEEIAEAEAERAFEASQVFQRQHRTDEATFDAAFKKQKGFCAFCGANLENEGRIHYNELTKKLVCGRPLCSPFNHQF